jgi:DNA-binding HxlR family transcriptional regulator
MLAKKKRKRRTIGVLGKLCTIEILEALNVKPLRFTDLRAQCSNDRTRTLRLKQLRRKGFIKTILIEIGEQNFIHYTITEKGKKH